MKTNSHFKYIGIDPGKSGGITMVDGSTFKTYKCPQRTEDMAILFSLLIGDTSSYDAKVLMERVWARPNNASSRAFTYGVNYGQWLGIAAANEIKMYTTLPTEWIRWVGCPKALKKTHRKNWLKDKAKELYPKINKVTLATSDAILIGHYARKEYFNE